ncbi:MAG TPA: hypothetical protein P5560_05745 [Thermotogota bacterium]|nr:hypothetical protein [Thermotogota bacterium]HRW92443.1 hypothetical protein [Thermotogota bacterium]
MEWLFVVLGGATLFFILMGNFKISRAEEKLQREMEHVHQQIVGIQQMVLETRSTAQLPVETAVEGQKTSLEELSGSIDAFHARLQRLEKSLAQIVPELREMRQEMQTQQEPKPVTPSEEPTEGASKGFQSFFSRNFAQSSEADQKMLRRVFNAPPGDWIKGNELGFDSSAALFQLPVLFRKWIFNGVPLIKMKEVAGSPRFQWGEGLSQSDREWVQAFFGEEVK